MAGSDLNRLRPELRVDGESIWQAEIDRRPKDGACQARNSIDWKFRPQEPNPVSGEFGRSIPARYFFWFFTRTIGKPRRSFWK